ncbi:MAG: FtsX-like permease family protein, partial [Herbinix sp.]|nr:FtsX-like permease family protein [Herbinix sp.]
MSFRKLCYINFKYNIKKSLAFFISAIFSCSVLFTYSYFLFNKTVGTGISEMGRDSEFLKYVMLTVLIIVVIFALFFIIYSYTSYMQSKNREFALYLTFGMGRKDIARISVFETTIIMILTFIMSFIVQYLISKPFLLIARKVLGYQDLAYEMPLVSTFINIITFIVIYISLLLSSYFKLYKLHIIQLFTLTNAQDICNKPKNIIIGPVLIVGALVLNSVSFVPMFFLISVLICMFGVYL